jgi:hypothetical protein
MPPKKSAKQLDRDIADALAIAQVRERWPQIADLLARSPGRSVSVAWTYDASVVADPSRRYHEASYAKTDLPTLLASLRKHGVQLVNVEDREFSL